MIIELNTGLSAPKPLVPDMGSQWSPDPVRSFHNGLKHTATLNPDQQLDILHPMVGDSHFRTNGYMDLLGKAYSQHYSIEVAPHDVWYIILTQIAEVIKDHPESFRSLFTTSKEKKLLLTDQPYEATEIDLLQLESLLGANVPLGSDLFLPTFTTTTPEARLAQIAAFADSMTPFYSYGMMCCGLPSIHLTGTQADWDKIVTSIEAISEHMAPLHTSAKKYLARALGIAQNIRKSWEQNQTAFWMDIFTQKNVGSGGDIVVNGWFKDLFVDSREWQSSKGFLTAVSVVPYTNLVSNREFRMMFGAFKGIILPDNVLQAQYAHATYEVVPKREWQENSAIDRSYNMTTGERKVVPNGN